MSHSTNKVQRIDVYDVPTDVGMLLPSSSHLSVGMHRED